MKILCIGTNNSPENLTAKDLKVAIKLERLLDKAIRATVREIPKRINK